MTSHFFSQASFITWVHMRSTGLSPASPIPAPLSPSLGRNGCISVLCSTADLWPNHVLAQVSHPQGRSPLVQSKLPWLWSSEYVMSFLVHAAVAVQPEMHLLVAVRGRAVVTSTACLNLRRCWSSSFCSYCLLQLSFLRTAGATSRSHPLAHLAE